MAEQRLMKDGLGESAVDRIIKALETVIPNFESKRFKQESMEKLESLELKERVLHLIDVLNIHLPKDFKESGEILLKVKENWDRGDENDPLGAFPIWPIIDYVGIHGLEEPILALKVLKELTGLFSAEFAIRPFITEYPEITWEHLIAWCEDKDPHVRRLASEGARPRLPWGKQLPQFIKDPTPVIELLELLQNDSSEYVRRSVANNLNDISKDHPEVVIKTCKNWLSKPTDEKKWIVRHATRTLVKAGHPDVFGLLGYTENPKVKLERLEVDQKEIKMGESVTFSATLDSTAKENQHFVVDYAVHHVKANGKTSPKVFKLKTVKLKPGETVELTKTQSFKKITTRKHYPGTHTIELLINGVSHGTVDFELI